MWEARPYCAGVPFQENKSTQHRNHQQPSRNREGECCIRTLLLGARSFWKKKGSPLFKESVRRMSMTKTWVSRGLSNVALAQALDTESVYVAKQRLIQVAMQLYTRFQRVKINALLDCGTTKNFIHPRLVKKMKLQTQWLKKLWKVKNVDGTTNKAEEVSKG